ncbi:MAG TPA: protein-methionine-sulfoxide reductase heme-binding subunit MsrQ [Burkholderiaceae bacterium]|nr:protein-methionine-sulfoxide reductase heme-binding subunit MsrQ [Burkholderiaceae bacterium]
MRRHLKPVLFVLCLLPLAWLLARAFGLAGAGLGANPVDEIQDRLGQWGLRLLLATLCVTPLATTLRTPWLFSVRRMLGLYAFTYVTLHFANWLVLDRWFDGAAIVADLAKRPYITAGFAGLVMLVPLALTSTNGWMRRLGRRWHALHRLVYPAAILGVVHYWWQVKADWREPLLYAIVLAALLGWRVRRARLRRNATAPAPVPVPSRSPAA